MQSFEINLDIQFGGKYVDTTNNLIQTLLPQW